MLVTFCMFILFLKSTVNFACPSAFSKLPGFIKEINWDKADD